MKKRKIKLVASVASLGLVCALLGVGVFAASSQAVKVTSRINLNVSGVSAMLTGAVTSDNNSDAVNPQPLLQSAQAQGDSTVDLATEDGQNTPLKTWLLGNDATTVSNTVVSVDTQLDDNGFGVAIGAKVTYTYTITNLGGNAIYYSVKLLVPEADDLVQYRTTVQLALGAPSSGGTASGADGMSTGGDGGIAVPGASGDGTTIPGDLQPIVPLNEINVDDDGYIYDCTEGIPAKTAPNHSMTFSVIVTFTEAPDDGFDDVHFFDLNVMLDGDSSKISDSVDRLRLETNNGFYPVNWVDVNENFPTNMPVPARNGFEFNGWYNDDVDPAEKVEGGTAVGDITSLIAKWDCKITFEANGGNSTVENDYILLAYEQPIGSALPTPTAPDDGQDWGFNGWFISSDFANSPVDETWIPIQSTTLYAKWTIKTYTVTIDVDLSKGTTTATSVGNLLKNATITVADNVLTIGTTEVTVNGIEGAYVFTGWKITPAGGSETALTSTYTITSNCSIVPTFSGLFTVTAASSNGSDGTATLGAGITTVAENSTITYSYEDNSLSIGGTKAITATAETGKQLLGWQITYGSGTATKIIHNATKVTGNCTITAVFGNTVPWTESGVYLGQDYASAPYTYLPSKADYNSDGIQDSIAYASFAGYTWVTFDKSPTLDSIRYIIVGAGDDSSVYKPSGTGSATPVSTAFSSSNADLESTEILLLSEVSLTTHALQTGNWNGSTQQSYLNNTANWATLGLPTTLTIQDKTLVTAYYTSATETKLDDSTTSTTSKIFILATKSEGTQDSTKSLPTNFASQNFLVQTYLKFTNDDYTNQYNYYAKSGLTVNGWFLRSGAWSSGYSKQTQYILGLFNFSTKIYELNAFSSQFGLRPAFVLDLA